MQALQIAANWTESDVKWTGQPATTGTAATTTSLSGWNQFHARNKGSQHPELRITFG
jgi:hypothetical protein